MMSQWFDLQACIVSLLASFAPISLMVFCIVQVWVVWRLARAKLDR